MNITFFTDFFYPPVNGFSADKRFRGAIIINGVAAILARQLRRKNNMTTVFVN